MQQEVAYTQDLPMQAIGVSGQSVQELPLTKTGTLDANNSNVSSQAQNGKKELPDNLPPQRIAPRDLVFTDLIMESVAGNITATSVRDCLPSVFDQFIAPCFGEMKNVDRSVWPSALRWRALNEAMDPTRQQKELPFVLREHAAYGRTTVRVILPD